jgi:hypothetical protein
MPSISKLVNHWKSLQHKQRIYMDSVGGDAFAAISEKLVKLWIILLANEVNE